ncbi:MAG: ribonuclease III [Clostridia bacterium]|nr:ribonuclease III [Clostridia bacterium]
MKPSQDWDEQIPLLAEKALGYTFQDKQLLKQCFTHKSFADNNHEPDNERLEFLGDAVLQLAVSESLYLRETADEGSMTETRKRYVSREALTGAAKKAGILEFMRYAGGEDTIGGKTPSNLFEAVVAGIYLDGGMNAARAFLKRFLEEGEFCNYKSLLQEYVQERDKTKPEYVTRERDGGYGCTVRALGKEAEGFGKSKKLAEVSAAEQLLKLFKERTE